MTKSLLHSTFALLLVAAGSSAGFAQRSWDGGNGSFVWGDNGNWNPDGSPTGEPISIGNLAAAANDTTLLDASYSIDSLTITNGADVINSTDAGATTEFELLVNGATTISNAGTSITVYGGGPDGDGLDSNTLTINSGGTLFLNSQTLAGTAMVEIDGGALTNNSGGTISGNGIIDLADNPAVATSLLINDGTISAGHLGIAIVAPARTLQIIATDPEARVDLDGILGSGIVNVNRNATLDVDVAINDAFGGDLNLFDGATFDVEGPWSINGGTVDVNTPGIFIGSAGPAAHLAGGTISFSGGTLTLNDGLDSLTLDAAFTGTGGVIDNSGTIIVNSVSTIGAGTDFNMNGDDAKLTVNGTLNVDTPDFNLDGTENAGNVTTINSGGILDLDLGAGADLSFGHTINMNGGELDVTSSAATAWFLNSIGTINAAGGAASAINSAGETFQIDGNINVTANSELAINSNSAYSSLADVVVDAGSTLNHSSATYSGGSYTGDGIFRKGTATIAAATTFNVAQFDLDDGATTLNANMTINADTVEPEGDGVDSDITIGNATALTVNLSGGGAWTVDSGGSITYAGDASAETYLAGSDVAMNGTINHNGDGRIDARLNIGSTGVVNINTAAEPLHLSGGNNSTNPNRISGGTINGVGILAADSGTALHGHGTISTDVDFNGTANLKADNGILSLTVGTPIVDVNEIGTADADGVLAVGSPWNTNVTGNVLLNGGEVRGAAITNDGGAGINGFGLLSAPVNNNSRIDAEGGTLVVQAPLNNNEWDGVANTGNLNAISGNLELRDNAAFLFNGSVLAEVDSEVFANGFELEFDPASSLTLNKGRYRSTHATDIGGTVTVSTGTSEIAVGGTTVFEAGSATTLDGTLKLNNPATQINSGATFAGGGVLQNSTVGNTLRLQDGADVDVLVHNQGTLVIGGGAAAQATGLDYQQDATGLWNVDLNGLGLNQFDRYTLTGAASLAGSLNIALGGGYVPALGDTFNILSAVGGVTGAFGTVLQPLGMPAGLSFNVVYQPTLTQLVVVDMLFGDYNDDGEVNAADYTVWRDNLGGAAVLPNDPSPGMVTAEDFDTWKANFGLMSGAGSGSLAVAAVPEPATLGLSGWLLLLVVRRSRRERETSAAIL